MTRKAFSAIAHLKMDGRKLRRILRMLGRNRCVIVTAWLVIGWAFQATVPFDAAGQVTGLSIVRGEGTIAGSGTANITLQQHTSKLIAHANQFDIIQGQTVQVLQPVGAAALIRVFDNKASTINGNLFASSLLFLLNPNGVLFGPTAQVNAGGLVASALHMSDADFLAGSYRLGTASTHVGLPDTIANSLVRNEGSITAGAQGVYLFAHNVENAGIIKSPDGHIVLAAGTSVFLSNRPDGRGLFVEVTSPTGQAVNVKDLIADGGQVSLFGRVVNQSGLVQANSVRERNGRIELVADERVTFSVGSRTEAKGDGQGVSDGGTIIAMATGGSGQGQVVVEPGATLDVSGGAQGGHGGLIALGGGPQGTNVTQSGSLSLFAQPGFVAGRFQLIPENLEISNLNNLPPVPDLTLIAMKDITVNGGFLNLSQLPLDAGRTGTLQFKAGGNIRFTDSFVNGGAGGRWNIQLHARNDILLTGADFVTTRAGSLELTAGRDIQLLEGSFGLSSLQTLQGGDITLSAGRDVITPGAFESGKGILVGGPGNLLISAGRDWLGSLPGSPVQAGPGFLLTNGTATVVAGRNIGSSKAYANLTLGRVQVTMTAVGSLFLGLAEDAGVAADPNRINVTADPNNNLNLRSMTGDIFLKPPSLANFETLRLIYPASFTAKADQGNIVVESNLSFWPSVTGRLDFFAGNNIRGVNKLLPPEPDATARLVFVGLPGLGGYWRWVTLEQAQADHVLNTLYLAQAPPPGAPPVPSDLLNNPPLVINQTPAPVVKLFQNDLQAAMNQNATGSAVGLVSALDKPVENVPDHQPASVRFATGSGDISTLRLDLYSPSLKKQIDVTSAGNITAFSSRMAAPDLGRDGAGVPIIGARVSAEGNIDLKKLGTQNAPSGMEFYGTGVAVVRAKGDLNLADSRGIVYDLRPGRPGDSNQGGLLDIAVGGNLEMVQTKINTGNGASIFIHGLDAGPLLDASGNPLVGPNGRPLVGAGEIVTGTQPARGGNPGTIGRPVLAESAGNGTATPILIFGKEVLVNDEAVLTPADVRHGTLVVDRNPVIVAPSGKMYIIADGKAYLVDRHPVIGADGRPILVDGRPALANGQLVLQVGGRSIAVVGPVGGRVNVGTNTRRQAEDTGIVTLRGGSIDIKAAGNVEVNRSRVATLGGGDIAISSTTGDVNAGSGGKDERTAFNVETVLPNGRSVFTTYEVPGSGIFTFHPNDPAFPLPFPKFDTPEILAIKHEIAKQDFLGRDTSSLKATLEAAVKAREPEFQREFDEFINRNPQKNFQPLELGDIALKAGRDIVVPPAGIRGRRITLLAGRDLNLQGGTIEGQIQFDVGGKLQGSPTAFVGSFSGTSAVGGSISGGASAGGSSLGGGLSGVTGTVAATASATAGTSSTASKSVESVQEKTTEASAQQAQADAKKTMTAKSEDKEGKSRLAQSVRVKRGVTIQVDVKPQGQPGG